MKEKNITTNNKYSEQQKYVTTGTWKYVTTANKTISQFPGNIRKIITINNIISQNILVNVSNEKHPVNTNFFLRIHEIKFNINR